MYLSLKNQPFSVFLLEHDIQLWIQVPPPRVLFYKHAIEMVQYTFHQKNVSIFTQLFKQF